MGGKRFGISVVYVIIIFMGGYGSLGNGAAGEIEKDGGGWMGRAGGGGGGGGRGGGGGGVVH